MRLSINAFAPKPFTPFQWSPMASEREIAERRARIFHLLSDQRDIMARHKRARFEILQGMFSLGDRRVGEVVYLTATQNVSWRNAWEPVGLGPDELLHRHRYFEDFLHCESY